MELFLKLINSSCSNRSFPNRYNFEFIKVVENVVLSIEGKRNDKIRQHKKQSSHCFCLRWFIIRNRDISNLSEYRKFLLPYITCIFISLTFNHFRNIARQKKLEIIDWRSVKRTFDRHLNV